MEVLNLFLCVYIYSDRFAILLKQIVLSRFATMNNNYRIDTDDDAWGSFILI